MTINYTYFVVHTSNFVAILRLPFYSNCVCREENKTTVLDLTEYLLKFKILQIKALHCIITIVFYSFSYA